MSTIVITKKNGYAVIAGDTLSTWGETKEDSDIILNHDKIISLDGNYFGFVGHSSWQSIFQRYYNGLKKKPRLNSVVNIFDFVIRFHKTLKKEYFVNTKELEDDTFESSQFYFLIANCYGIFGVDSKRYVEEYKQYYAYGSGFRIAIGAMYAVWDYFDDPMKIAEVGVKAGAKFDQYTGLPLTAYKIKLKK